MKPLIGITCNHFDCDEWGFSQGIGKSEQAWTLLADDYCSIVEQEGGIPIMIPFFKEKEPLIDLIDILDGVIVSGGNDIDPQLYNEWCYAQVGSISNLRDTQDVFITNYVLDNTDKPYLGICRGIQILAAARGGSLFQHLPEDGYKLHSLLSYAKTDPSHYVNIEPKSLLYDILETEKIHVNSFHHQSVKKVPDEFIVQAYSPDGVIESIAHKSKKFALGVQWHPEMNSQWPHSKKIFREFINVTQKTR